MATHLKEVIDFCETGFKNGKLIPLSFSFPSFEITEDMFKEAAMNVVAEKVRLGLDYGSYKQEVMEVINKQVASKVKSEEYGNQAKKMIAGISYDDLVDARIAINEGTATVLQKNQLVFADAILARQMSRDDNLNYIEISKKTILESCNDRLKDKLNDISMLQTLSVYDSFETRNSISGELISKKNDLVASLLLMKEQIPSVYKQFKKSMNNIPNQSLVTELENMEANPDILIVQKIAKFDNNFAQNNYPKQCKELKSMEQALKIL